MRSFARFAAAAVLGAVVAAPAQAASVSYFLTNSDILPDGQNYLQVTISDGLNGAVDFTVQALQPLLDRAGPGFGIYKFGFNVIPGVDSPVSAIVNFPTPGWSKGPQQDMGGFGRFDRRLRTTSFRAPVSSTLTFSIVGVNLDTILSYVDLSVNSTEGPAFFAAGVQGINLGNNSCGPNNGPTSGPRALRRASSGCKIETTRAFFGGVQAVPAPPAVWLLATGVAAVVARRFRKRAA